MHGPQNLTLLHVFPTFAVGGAQARFATLANSMGTKARHIVLALDGRYDAKARLNPDLGIVYPHFVGVKDAFLRSVMTFQRLLNEWAPSTLVTYNWGAIEFAFANALPKIRHVHVIDGFGSDEYFVQLRRRVVLTRMALSRSTIIVPSTALRDIVTNDWGIDAAQVCHVPNGIDLTLFNLRSSSNRRTAPVTVGTVAALRPEKNLARLLIAFARTQPLSSVRLIVVGDGECRSELTALARCLNVGDRVSFSGHQDCVNAQLRQFDIFALSSDTEQMPIVVLEAMASGIPIVATDVGDIRAMVADANAPLIVGAGADGLTRAINCLARDPGMRARIGRANRIKAEQCFTVSNMVRAWEAILMTS